MAGNEKIRVGVIGLGEWGPNHVRVFAGLPGVEVPAVADLRQDRLDAVRRQHRWLRPYQGYKEMLGHERLDAVVVATPTASHYGIVRGLLEAGKHVLCEKPLSDTVEGAQELVGLAADRRLMLMVGHVFLFNTGILKLKEHLEFGDLGRVYYLTSVRTNLGPIRRDVGAAFDLASHDVAIFNFLLDATPVEVSAVGKAYLRPDLEDVASISLTYPGEILVTIRVSWLDPRKVRQITIVGERKMMMWDELSSLGPVMLFDKGVQRERHYEDYGQFQLRAREGDVLLPRVVAEEPLKAQARHFIECLRNRRPPLSDGGFALDVMRALEAIARSMAGRGAPLAIVGEGAPIGGEEACAGLMVGGGSKAGAGGRGESPWRVGQHLLPVLGDSGAQPTGGGKGA